MGHSAKPKRVKRGEKKIVFTNGIFDIVHKGHIDLLKFAKAQGDRLVVGLNSDRSARALKGPDRPWNREKDRKEFLEGLEFVDEVVIFDELNTAAIVRKIKPDIVVKGNEWPVEELRRKDDIPAEVEIILAPLAFPREGAKKYSTTDLIKKLKG